MIGLTSLEVNNSIFNITEENNKFEFYTDTFDDFSFTELKDELDEIRKISNVTCELLQDDILGPCIFSAYKKLETEKRQTDGYYMLLMGYARSKIRDFESYLRIVVGLDEDDIQVILKQYNSNFVTYELSPCIYTIKGIAEAANTKGDHEGTLKIENDKISMKTKLILKRFVGTFGNLRFIEKSFFHTSLKFTPYWDFKPTKAIHVDSPGVYTIDKILNLRTIGKIHLKCDVIDSSVVKGIRESTLFGFVLDKPAGYKVFSPSETVLY